MQFKKTNDTNAKNESRVMHREINDNEINLREWFLAFWAHKAIITIFLFAGIYFSGYYSINLPKKFTSTAVFKVDSDNSSSLDFGLNSPEITNLLGINTLPSTAISKDEVEGRIFIQDIDKVLNFKSDKYFNTYNPNTIDPLWKTIIKKILSYKKDRINIDEAIWQNIIYVYSKSVEIDTTISGATKIEVIHENPFRAAEIANHIMERLITKSIETRNKKSADQLDYMARTLAKSFTELEAAQSKLKIFALENSALPLEAFAASSLELEELRVQLRRTTKLLNACVALKEQLEANQTGKFDYISLREKFPVIDQIEFRRILGLSETINSWSWPNVYSVSTVINNLSERLNRLQSEINLSQVDAAKYGEEQEKYLNLEREAAIAEASYTVLIEQVKAQNMVSGYRPDQSKIYDYAVPSINASSPNRNIIMAWGAFIGLFIGILISFIIITKRGVFYSISSIIEASQPRLSASAKNLKSLKYKKMPSVRDILFSNVKNTLCNFALELEKSDAHKIIISSLKSKIDSKSFAKYLATYMETKNSKIAIINFSQKKLNNEKQSILDDTFIESENIGQISLLDYYSPPNVSDYSSKKNLQNNINLISKKYNFIFICVDDNEIISLLRILEKNKLFHIMLTRTKKTKTDLLSDVRSLRDIQGLLYD